MPPSPKPTPFDFVNGISDLGDRPGAVVDIIAPDGTLVGRLDVLTGGVLMTTAVYGDVRDHGRHRRAPTRGRPAIRPRWPLGGRIRRLGLPWATSS